MNETIGRNVRSFLGSKSPSTLLHGSFSYIIKTYLRINAEEEGFLISSPWMACFSLEKDANIACYLNIYQHLESKWSTELDFCNTNDIVDINASFEKELAELLMNLIDYTEENYGPILFEE